VTSDSLVRRSLVFSFQGPLISGKETAIFDAVLTGRIDGQILAPQSTYK